MNFLLRLRLGRFFYPSGDCGRFSLHSAVCFLRTIYLPLYWGLFLKALRTPEVAVVGGPTPVGDFRLACHLTCLASSCGAEKEPDCEAAERVGTSPDATAQEAHDEPEYGYEETEDLVGCRGLIRKVVLRIVTVAP